MHSTVVQAPVVNSLRQHRNNFSVVSPLRHPLSNPWVDEINPNVPKIPNVPGYQRHAARPCNRRNLAVELRDRMPGRATGGGNHRIGPRCGAVKRENPVREFCAQHPFKARDEPISAFAQRHHCEAKSQLRLAGCRQKKARRRTIRCLRLQCRIRLWTQQFGHHIGVKNEHG